jgi:hypothetical protein
MASTRPHPRPTALALAGLALVVLTAAGIMAVRGSGGEPAGAFSAPLADGEVALAAQPGTVGSNEIHLYITDEAGRLREVTAPQLTVSVDGSRREVNLSRVSAGHYFAVQQHLPHEGAYDLTVTATVDGSRHQTTGGIEVGASDPGLAQRLIEWCSVQLSRARQ